MIDYRAIIEQLDSEKIINLMQTLGAENYIDKPGYIIFPTICHNIQASEASMKLYYYKNSHMMVCFTECGTMNIFQFLKHYYETRQITYDWHQDIYEVILDCSNYKQIDGFVVPRYQAVRATYNHPEPQELPTYPQGIINVFTKFYPPEWLQDGITKKSMDKFNIRYSIPQNKIIIPHYNPQGELIGIRGRALNEWEVENVGKYMPVQIEGKWYSHPLSLNLYGLNWNKENIKRTGICFLVESEKACMQFESFNFANCTAAVCGSQFNKYALKLLMKTAGPREIVVCFDKEEEKGDKYFNKLYQLCEKYKTYADFSFIYDMTGLLDMKDSPTDKGEYVFWELYRKRIKVK